MESVTSAKQEAQPVNKAWLQSKHVSWQGTQVFLGLLVEHTILVGTSSHGLFVWQLVVQLFGFVKSLFKKNPSAHSVHSNQFSPKHKVH